MTQTAIKQYHFEIVFAPLAPRLRRNLSGLIMSNEIPENMGDEDSNKFRNLGGPRGGSNLAGSLLVLMNFTQFSISG